jgi:hypothetical protein
VFIKPKDFASPAALRVTAEPEAAARQGPENSGSSRQRAAAFGPRADATGWSVT